MTLRHGDCLEVLATLDECSVDACITDPPYHLTSIVRRFGAPDAKGPNVPVYQRSVGGFMGQTWDGGDLSFKPETWAAVLRVLKPGAALLAMGATRCWHRTAVAIEDAGFDIRDSIAWLYGSGFPKSRNQRDEDGAKTGLGTALKPMWEPVVVARKPLDGTHDANYERWGTGYLDIDAIRVPLNGDTVPEFEDTGPTMTRPMPGLRGKGRRVVGKRGGEKVERGGRHPITGRFCEPGKGAGRTVGEATDEGRWPANVAHDGSGEVMGEFPHGASGAHTSARFYYTAKPSKAEKEAGLHGFPRGLKPAIRRKVEANLTLNDATCGYTGGGTTPRANIHPTCKPLELFRWLVRGFVPKGGVVLDPFLGSGTTAIAAVLEGRRYIGIEREEEYMAIATARLAWWTREATRKPGRTVAQILGEAPRKAAPADERQRSLL